MDALGCCKMQLERALIAYPILVTALALLIVIEKGFDILLVVMTAITIVIALLLRSKLVKDKQLQS